MSASLGSFAAASKRLFTTQSTIAKRVGELEGIIGTALFDRGSRKLRLTAHGQRLLLHAQDVMESHGRLMRSFPESQSYEGRVRIGATELVGLTWLPLLIQSMRKRYPLVEIEPEIDGGVRLYQRLDSNEIDIAIMPGPFSSPSVESFFISEVENAWMAGPSLRTDKRVLTPQDISAFPVIVQPTNSALTLLYESWFRTNDFTLQQVLTCNSLGMVAQLTMYGLGFSYLPSQYFAPLVDDGRLRVLNVVPQLPPVQYFAYCRRDNKSSVVTEVLETAERVHDFALRMMG